MLMEARTDMILPCDDHHIERVHLSKDGQPLGSAAARTLGLITEYTPPHCGMFLDQITYDYVRTRVDAELRKTHQKNHRNCISAWLQDHPTGEECIQVFCGQFIGWVVDGACDKLTAHRSMTAEAVITPDPRSQGSRLRIATMYPVIDSTPTPKNAQVLMAQELIHTREWKNELKVNPNHACVLLNRTLPTTPSLVYTNDVIRYPINEHHQLELDGNRLADRVDGVRYPFNDDLTTTPWDQPIVSKAVGHIKTARTIFLRVLCQHPAEDIRREKREQRAATQVTPVPTAAQPTRILNESPNESGIDQ